MNLDRDELLDGREEKKTDFKSSKCIDTLHVHGLRLDFTALVNDNPHGMCIKWKTNNFSISLLRLSRINE